MHKVTKIFTVINIMLHFQAIKLGGHSRSSPLLPDQLVAQALHAHRWMNTFKQISGYKTNINVEYY